MATKTDGREPSQKELQRKITDTRDSLRSTVEAIQDKAEQQYETAKQTVSDVLDYRDEFQKEPVVWSLGALSAGSWLHGGLLSQGLQDKERIAV